MEASLLQAKIHYCKGLYQSAIDVYNRVKLDEIKESQVTSSRLLCILAESHAIKGKSLLISYYVFSLFCITCYIDVSTKFFSNCVKLGRLKVITSVVLCHYAVPITLLPNNRFFNNLGHHMIRMIRVWIDKCATALHQP